MIKIHNLTKKYTTGEKSVVANNNINLEFNNNGLYMIVGKSGCGKTTLLNLISTLDKSDSGSIFIDGVEIANSSESELDSFRRNDIGIVFQDFNLLPELTVYENLMLAINTNANSNSTNETINNRISETLKSVNLENYEKRHISQLSGGERQRVAIARTLIKQPKVILADEPTGNLDSVTSNNIFNILKEISQRYLVIVITHDNESAYKFGDYIVNMSDGEITSITENTQYLYSVTTSCSVDSTPISISKIDCNQLIELIKSKINNEPEGGYLKIDNIEKLSVNSQQSDCTNNNMCLSNDKHAEKLSLINKLKIAFAFLKKKTVRMILAIIMLSISVVLFYSSVYVSFYDEKQVMVEYLNTYNPMVLPVYTEENYTDKFYTLNTTTYNSGKSFKDAILNAFAELDSIYVVPTITEKDVYIDTTEETENMEEITVFFAEALNNRTEITSGKSDLSDNEIIITDYLARKLSVDIGDKLKYQGTSLKIVGIIKTDYKEYGLIPKLRYGDTSEYVDYYNDYKYSIAYINPSFIDNMYKNRIESISFPCSNFIYSKQERAYIDSYVNYYGLNAVNPSYLIEGRMPSSSNEVVVSVDFASQYMNYNMDEGFNFTYCEYQFKDMYADNYNNYYNNILNFYDFFPEGVEIVGIVQHQIEDDVFGDVYLNDNIWNEIKDYYYDNCYLGNSLFVCIDDYETVVDKLAENKIKIDEPAINTIGEFTKTLESIKNITYLLCFLTLLLTVITIFNFINTSTSENKKSIGIIRSLGISMKDTKQIFVVEFLIIFVLSLIISAIAIIMLLNYVNSTFIASVKENPYNIVCLNVLMLTIVYIIVFVIHFIATDIPIRRLNKLKLIDVIRNN